MLFLSSAERPGAFGSDSFRYLITHFGSTHQVNAWHNAVL